MAGELTKERLTFYEEKDAIEKRLQDDDRKLYDQAVKNGESKVVLKEGIAIIGEKRSYYKTNGKTYFLDRWTSSALAPSNW